MDEAGGNGSSVRWSTAIALSVAVLLLSVFDAVPLVALPLAVLLVALPAERRWKWVAVGALACSGSRAYALPSASDGAG